MSAAVEQLAPTAVEGDAIVFRLADAAHALLGVKLWCDLDLGERLDLAEVPGGWELRLPLPDLDCIEYLFEITTDGDSELRPDPTNPAVVDGAFGEHSWLAPAGLRASRLARPASRGGGTPLGAGSRVPRSVPSTSTPGRRPMPLPASGSRCCSPTTAPRWMPSRG